MQHQTNLTAQKPQSYGGLTLKDDTEGQRALVVELYDRFHAMKTYGKEPESLESITRIFKKDLAKYPTDKIMKALSIHAERSDEFPTVSDISGLIKRNGKPPMKESDVIAVRKKDGQDRTPDDWALLREWDAQQRDDAWESPSDEDIQRTREENIRLRTKVKELEEEYQRLAGLLRAEQLKNLQPAEKPKISLEERTQRTIDAMKSEGVSQEDIDSFIMEQSSRISPQFKANEPQAIGDILGKLTSLT